MYRLVRRSEWGGAYREEAALREAEVLIELGNVSAARRVLRLAKEQFKGGMLEPERRALLERWVKAKASSDR